MYYLDPLLSQILPREDLLHDSALSSVFLGVVVTGAVVAVGEIYSAPVATFQ